jgi:hypothetical protein
MNAKSDGIRLLGEHRRGETFEVGGHTYVDFLSHGTVLEDCTLISRASSRGVVFHGSVLRRCLIQTKRRFTNFSWHDVVLEGCTFKGWFIGNDFGPRPEAYPDQPQGAASACDFSQSHLHMCRFFRSEMELQKLPKWPCFTVLEPEQNATDWLSIGFPEGFRRVEQQLIAEAVPEFRVEGVVAASQHAGEIAKRHGITLDEIRTLVSGKSYIML